MQPNVRQERTGWRDEDISARHRLWGWDCPAIDIDFLMVEYDYGSPKALIEYKYWNETARHPNLNSPSYAAIRELADNSKIPFLIVFYFKNPWIFHVVPGNQFASLAGFPDQNRHWTEREFVESLYRLRGRLLPQDIDAKLCRDLPTRVA